MLFNSFEFLVFLPIVVVLYYLIPYKFRWILLLAASYYFYMSWKVEYIVLIMASTLVDYFAAGQMAKLPDKRSRKPYLWLSLLVNLGLLVAFKYYGDASDGYGFIPDNINALAQSIGIGASLPEFKYLLPVGISFYTFQTLSYTIDVYNGAMKPERHLGIFAVYVSFFPQLVAGPIERAPNLMPQFRERFVFDYDRVKMGVMLMAWGFFKKLVIADRVAEYVNMVYAAPERFDGLASLFATYMFAFQIYCDFSGYSDIAIGTAAIMGYKLMTNFRRPYFAASIQNFWQRWHISLSTWFRDYVYIPLGGNRTVKWRWYYNLLATFLISGLWHGASWNFVIWGAIHGGLLVVGIWTFQMREKIYAITGLASRDGLRRFVQTFIVFHLAVFAWVFFRAETFWDANQILRNLGYIQMGDFMKGITRFGLMEVGIAMAAIFFMEWVHWRQEIGVEWRRKISGMAMPLRWSIYVFAVVLVILFGKFAGQAEFIYFQF